MPTALIEGARVDGRTRLPPGGRARRWCFPLAFRAAYFLYRHLGIVRFVADRLADRVELLLVTRLLVDKLLAFNDRRLGAIFGHAHRRAHRQRSSDVAAKA